MNDELSELKNTCPHFIHLYYLFINSKLPVCKHPKKSCCRVVSLTKNLEVFRTLQMYINAIKPKISNRGLAVSLFYFILCFILCLVRRGFTFRGVLFIQRFLWIQHCAFTIFDGCSRFVSVKELWQTIKQNTFSYFRAISGSIYVWICQPPSSARSQ